MDDYRDKMKIIEAHLGSKGKAAVAAGVTLNSWSRWHHGHINPSPSSRRVIELLFDGITKNPAESGQR